MSTPSPAQANPSMATSDDDPRRVALLGAEKGDYCRGEAGRGSPPAAIVITPDCAAVGTVLWPESFFPQTMTLPSLFNARLCHPPAAIAVTPDCAAVGMVLWPESLLPQAITWP